MERKSDKVRRLVAAGEYRKALAIAKDFRIGITKEQSDVMKRGFECLSTSPKFYESLGMDVYQIVQKAQETLVSLYGS